MGRRMSVFVNGKTIADSLRLDTYHATYLSHTVEVTNGHIEKIFTSIEGATILNAVKIEPIEK